MTAEGSNQGEVRPTRRPRITAINAMIVLFLVLLIGFGGFAGYTMINDATEKTACEQIADPAQRLVNASHAWDLYQVYLNAPSPVPSNSAVPMQSEEGRAIDALNAFCRKHGVDLDGTYY